MRRFICCVFCICLLVSAFPAFAASAADYSDVKVTDWYYDAVNYAAENSLFSGTSPTTFSPKAAVTRGMFVTVLGKYAGASGYPAGSAKITEAINMRTAPGTDKPIAAILHSGDTASIYGIADGWYSASANGATGYIRCDVINASCANFGDVSLSAYYAKYVNWAYANGVVSGTSASSFSPSASISREAICGILFKYAQKQGISLNQTVSKLAFSDESAINPAFVSAVYAMQGAGIISGRPNGSFAPKATATRAETAVILQKFIQNTGKAPAKDYGYSGTVPQRAAAADSYFDDACFIGHSLVVGMKTYFNLLKADYYAVNGISASRMLTYADFELPDGGKGGIADALSQKTYGKVYIMLGVNELSSAPGDRQAFYNSMSSLISTVKQRQPSAKIYVISLTPITKAESNSSATYNRENALNYNGVLQQLCRDKGAGYLDFFTLFCDDDGYMPAEGAASDGIHPVQSQYALMKNYLKTHT